MWSMARTWTFLRSSGRKNNNFMSDSNNQEIPGAAELVEGNGGLPKVVVETPWSSAEIYLHGAHVTHFQKKGEAPLLFLSAASEFTTGKPIRGGVPIIFPWFGPREGLPGHGFARTVQWEFATQTIHRDGSISLHFNLPTIEFYEVEYIVTVGENLTLELVVGNTGERNEVFETCLHTYFQIGAINTVSITGLSGCDYLDKVLQGDFKETGESIRISSEVDRVYTDTTATVEITDPTLGRKIRVAKSGSHSTVVWNPWIDKSKAMADFGDEEYLHMVCVESSNVGSNKITLPPGERSVMKVELSSEKL